MKIKCNGCSAYVEVNAETFWRCRECNDIHSKFLEMWEKGEINGIEFYGNLTSPITVLNTSYATSWNCHKSHQKLSEIESDFYNPDPDYYDDDVEERYAALHFFNCGIFYIDEKTISSYDYEGYFSDLDEKARMEPYLKTVYSPYRTEETLTDLSSRLGIKAFTSKITKEASRALTDTCYNDFDFKTVTRVYDWNFLKNYSGKIRLGLKTLSEKNAYLLMGNKRKMVDLPDIEKIDHAALSLLSKNSLDLSLGLKNLTLDQAEILGNGFGSLSLPKISRLMGTGKFDSINKRQGSIKFLDYHRDEIIN